MYDRLDDAIELARFAHRKQVDKSGMPYIDHPLRVLATVQAQGARPYVQMAAILHDVAEDTPFDLQTLGKLGFTYPVVWLVQLLSRSFYNVKLPNGQKYKIHDEDYYRRIKGNPDALMIKLADINDNLQEWRLSYLDEETQKRLRKKYAKAKEALTGYPAMI